MIFGDSGSPCRRQAGACRWLVRLSVAVLALGGAALGLLPATRASAQSANRAALVIQYGDGSLWTRCVEFAEPEITGLELLLRSGLDVVRSSSGMGDLICKIGREGCANPSQCLCQCKGAQCAYWSYWQLEGGVWQYAPAGASMRTARDGAVDGWVWGAGSVSSAPQPPQVRFGDICQAARPTFGPSPTGRATGTATSAPGATPPPTVGLAVLPSPLPTATDTATPTPLPPATTPSATATQVAAEGGLAAVPHPSPTRTYFVPPALGPTPAGDQSSYQAARPGYLYFLGLLLVLVALGTFAWLRGRTGT